MKDQIKILVTSAGGAPANNFMRSLRKSHINFIFIGVDCNKYNAKRSEADIVYLVPRGNAPDYIDVMKSIIADEVPDMLYSPSDDENPVLSAHRAELQTKMFLPSHEDIEACGNKFELNQIWKEAGIKVPTNIILNTKDDLEHAMREIGPKVWLRPMAVRRGGGIGSFCTDDLEAATIWVNSHHALGKFTAASYLSPDTTTFQSIWHNGELVVAQIRRRLYWELSSTAPSGVTGITGTGVTDDDPITTEVALKSIKAINNRPHGIWSVDMTYDADGIPNPTEINIGRFFTTHNFFTEAGLNMPLIFVSLALDIPIELPEKRINPLPSGLAWIRGVDFMPTLTTLSEIDSLQAELDERLARIRKQLP